MNPALLLGEFSRTFDGRRWLEVHVKQSLATAQRRNAREFKMEALLQIILLKNDSGVAPLRETFLLGLEADQVT